MAELSNKSKESLGALMEELLYAGYMVAIEGLRSMPQDMTLSEAIRILQEAKETTHE